MKDNQRLAAAIKRVFCAAVGSRRVARTGLALALVCSTAGCGQPKGHKATGKAQPRWQQAQLAVARRLAEENLAAGKFDRAQSALAAFEQSDDGATHVTLARIDVERGEYEAALSRLERFLSSRKSTAGATAAGTAALEAECHHLRGVCLEAAGRTHEAAAAYERAWALLPSATTLAAWVETLVLDGRGDQARALMERERSRFPGDVQLCEVGARLRLLDGDAAGAAREMQSAADAVTDVPRLAGRIAEAHLRSGDFGAAADIWRKLRDVAADPAARRVVQRRLAAAELAAGRFGEARRLYRELVGQDGGDVAAQLGLATASLLTGDVREALAAARAAESGGSTAAAAQVLRALCHERLGETAQAVRVAAGIGEGEFSGEVRELLRRWDAQ